MAHRTALLIHCSEHEVRSIRERAALERRTVSGYVLNIVMRAVVFYEEALDRFKGLQEFSRARTFPTQRAPIPGPRTTMLLRCSVPEADRIRLAAKTRSATISSFVLQSLRRSWGVADGLLFVAPQPGKNGDQRPQL